MALFLSVRNSSISFNSRELRILFVFKTLSDWKYSCRDSGLCIIPLFSRKDFARSKICPSIKAEITKAPLTRKAYQILLDKVLVSQLLEWSWNPPQFKALCFDMK
jgi:hypothetical protein